MPLPPMLLVLLLGVPLVACGGAAGPGGAPPTPAADPAPDPAQPPPPPDPDPALEGPLGPFAYVTFGGETLSRYAWLSERLAFLTERGDLDRSAMVRMAAAFESAYDYYRDATGRDPAPFRQHAGRLSVAEVPSTCGAGCGYLGATGIELTTSWIFGPLYEGIRLRDEYDQALFYELGRNFWFYGAQLDLQAADTASPGVLATGYAVLMRFLSMDAAGVAGGPFHGTSYRVWRGRVEGMVDTYAADPRFTFDTTFRTNTSPDPGAGGTTDLFASLVLRLIREHGAGFERALWREVGLRPAARTTQDAVDNFVLAASAAAGQSLVSRFADAWRWPVSTAARAEAARRWP